MNICITNTQFLQLKKLCHDSRKEILGEMNFKEKNGNYYLSSINCYDSNNKDYIESSTRKSVVNNSETYLTGLLLEAMNNENKKGLIVRFHTHPGFIGLAHPSESDKEIIKYSQSAIDRVNMKYNKNLLYAEGIITSSEIGFYYTENGVIKRIKVFIDGSEFIPREPNSKDKRTFFEALKSGYNEGISEAKISSKR